MKKVNGCIAVILMTVFCSPLFSASKDAEHRSQQDVAAASSNNKQMNQMNNMDSSDSMPQDDCSQLTTEEQNFASKLNDMNAMNFCSKMSSMQRQKAMQMTNTKGASGAKMSPDDSVQKVMMDNGNKQPARNAGGACPVK